MTRKNNQLCFLLIVFYMRRNSNRCFKGVPQGKSYFTVSCFPNYFLSIARCEENVKHFFNQNLFLPKIILANYYIRTKNLTILSIRSEVFYSDY